MLEPVEAVSRSGIRAGIWNGFDPEAIAIARAKGTEEDQARSFESFDARSREETDALLALGPWFPQSLCPPACADRRRERSAIPARRISRCPSVWNEIDTLAERNGTVAWRAQALNQRALIEIALGDLRTRNETEQEANNLLIRLGPGRRPELFTMEMATARACYLGGDFARLADFWIAFADDPALGPGESASLLGPFFAAAGAFAATEAGQPAKASATLAILTPLLERMPLGTGNLNGAVAFAALATWNCAMPNRLPPTGDLLAACWKPAFRTIPRPRSLSAWPG